MSVPDRFFLEDLAQKPGAIVNKGKGKKRRVEVRESEDSIDSSEVVDSISSEEEEEADVKRLRLAEQFISQFKEEEVGGKLETQAFEKLHQLRRSIAEQWQALSSEQSESKRVSFYPTCVVMSPDCSSVFMSFKNGEIFQFACPHLAIQAKIHPIAPNVRLPAGKVGHRGSILSLAMSSDGRYLVGGGDKQVIYVWQVTPRLQLVHELEGHRGSVLSLAFKIGSYDLYSCADTGMVKVWNLEEFMYVETLYGHSASALCLSVLSKPFVLSCGVDLTARVWKIEAQSQLLFSKGISSPIDACCMIDDALFALGSQKGEILLYNKQKRKPLHVELVEEQGGSSAWITAMCACPRSDVMVTGTLAGKVQLWSVSSRPPFLQLIREVSLEGCIVSLAVSADGSQLAIAVGREHRLGRWVSHRHKNKLVLIRWEDMDTTLQP